LRQIFVTSKISRKIPVSRKKILKYVNGSLSFALHHGSISNPT